MSNKNYTGFDVDSLHEKYGKQKHESARYTLFLVILLLFHAVANLVWIYLNKNPLDFDPIGHTLISINSAEYVKTHILSFNLRDYMLFSPAYPNFTHTISLILIFIFGNYWKVIQCTGTIFFLLTIFGTFLYVKEISRKPQIAFLSAFFYSFFVSVVQYSRFHMLDIPLTAMIIFTMYFWERLKKTGHYRYLYASAFTFAFAELTKWHAVIFLFVPALFLLIWAIKHKKFHSTRFILHIVFCIGIIIILVLPWYYYNFENFIKLGAINFKGEADDPHNLLSSVNIFFYTRLIINYQIQFVGLLIFLYSSIKIALKKPSYMKISLLSVLFNYAFFTFFVINKNIRVLFPVMPFIALILAFGANELLRTTHKAFFLARTVFSAVMTYIVLSFFILSFGIPFYPNVQITGHIPGFNELEVLYLHTYPVNLLYNAPAVNYESLVNTILRYKPYSDKPLQVVVAVNLLNFQNDHILIELYRKYSDTITYANTEILNKQITLTRLDQLYDNFQNNNDFESTYTLKQPLSSIDFIFTSLYNPIHPEQRLDALYTPIKTIQNYLLGESNDTFVPINREPLPNGDTVFLYINKKLLR
ncbi:MAG: glycosyltransferase family 39 protein [bacterium]